jgi:aminoglycoside 2''-phosphotransferase
MESVESAQGMIRECFPNFAITKIEAAGEGMESCTYLVNDTYIFRFPKRPQAVEDVEIEITLLPALQTHLSVPIPQFEFVGRREEDVLFVGYKKIEGVALDEIWENASTDEQEILMRALGLFLQEVHAFPIDQAHRCGVPLHRFRRVHNGDFGKVLKDLAPSLEEETLVYLQLLHQKYMEEERNLFFDSVLLHADFSPGHIFCDPQSKKITGVIDFGDTGLGDPDYDLLYLFGAFGWDFILRFLPHYHRTDVDPVLLHQKLRFLLLHNTLDDLWMGKDRNDGGLQEWAMRTLQEQVEKISANAYW